MRKVILATAGVLLVVGGVLMAAFTAIAPSDAPSVIGPAVVIGSAPPSSRPGTPAATATGGDHGAQPVSPSPAVQVTDDHGGGRGGGGGGHDG